MVSNMVYTVNQRLQIFHKVDPLPSLPATVSKVMAITAAPESSAKDLVQAILPDAGKKEKNALLQGFPHCITDHGKGLRIKAGFPHKNARKLR